MKRYFTLLAAACFCLTSIHAQYNLFDAADVDADGWLWLNTPEKIAKYVGIANDEENKIDPNGKIIQLIVADHGGDVYLDSEADATFVGAGTDGEPEGEGAKTGGIKLAPASKESSINGGGMVVQIPSTCTSFNLYLSSEKRMLGHLTGSTDINKEFNNYTVISVKYLPPFSRTMIGPAGQKEWSEMEILNNGQDIPFGINTAAPMYAMLQNCQTYPLFIHGLKVLTSTPSSSIGENQFSPLLSFDGTTLAAKEEAHIEIFSLSGVQQLSTTATTLNLSTLPKAIYIVKAKTNAAQETIKVMVQ